MSYKAAAVSEHTAGRLGQSSDYDFVSNLLDSGIDLDKAWFATQVLLTGSFEQDEPLFTGGPLGEDLGMGPLIYAAPADVVRVAATMQDLTLDSLVERFDPADMEAADAYPGVWDEDADELAAWIAQAAMDLVGLYRTAAEQGLGIVALMM